MRVRLGDVCTIKQGVVKDTSNSVWLLNLDKVESETGKIIEFQYVDPNKIGTSTCQFDTGNVLYSKLRPYLNKVVLPDKEGFATSEMLPIRPDTTRILREYLTYYLRSPEFVAYISDKVAGAKMPRARTEDLLNVRLQLPTLDEQTDIVKILSIVSILITQRKQQLCQLDDLVKSQFIEMFGDLHSNRFLWPKSTLGMEFVVTSGGTPSTGNEEYWNNGNISWIGSNMCQNIILTENDGKYITKQGFENSSAKLYKPGCVLIALVGATIGKTALLRIKTTTNQNIAGIDVNCNEKFTSEFVFYYIQSLYYKFMEIGDGQFKMANLSFIRGLELLCPPLELQERFASLVVATEKSKFAIQKSLETLKSLKNALMQQYFG
ncbi:MAG: restriction endonuclease subunit S [Clostridia bacterium]|nr:restriction endonuclease subunit S [Clostridia bacterium]NCC83818.1 restriction endonuclease subunit S [Clostridia bacterium]